MGEIRIRYPQRRRRISGSVLAKSQAYWKASRYPGSGALLDLTGHGHNAQLGSTSGADTNDPLFLTNALYLYLPGVLANDASIPDEAALDITGDIDIRVAVQLESYTPATTLAFIARGMASAATGGFELLLRTTTNLLELGWVTSGGFTSKTSTVTLASVVSPNAMVALRVTLDVDNGAAGHDVKFYWKLTTLGSANADTRSHTGWTQLGATVTTAAVTSLDVGAIGLWVGSREASAFPVLGKTFAAVVLNGLAGSEILAIDFTNIARYNPTRTSLTAETGQTVTINRTASGRRSVVVDRPLFLLGVDDYFEIADHASLDVGATDDFTLMIAFRSYTTAGTAEIWMSKRSTAAGWLVQKPTSAIARFFTEGQAAVTVTDDSGAVSTGTALVVSARRLGTAHVAFVDGVSNGATAGTAQDTANSIPLHIGQANGAGFAAMEFIGAAFFRFALTDAEVARASLELLVA